MFGVFTFGKGWFGRTAARAGFSGQLDSTLDDVTLDSSGEVLVSGVLVITLEDVSGNSTGVILVSGSCLQTLEDVLCISEGRVARIEGHLIVTLDDVTLVAKGKRGTRTPHFITRPSTRRQLGLDEAPQPDDGQQFGLPAELVGFSDPLVAVAGLPGERETTPEMADTLGLPEGF